MHASVMTFGKAAIKDSDVRGKRIIEVGSMNVNGSLRGHVESFTPSTYVGVDFIAGLGVDVVCDANDLVKRFGNNSFDVVISTEMLEHAENWRAAVYAIKHVLVPSGLLLLTARGPGFPLHGHPHDWNRFTPNDMARIFADFTIVTLQADPECPGFLLLARKPVEWNRESVDLGLIHVAPADAVNAPRSKRRP